MTNKKQPKQKTNNDNKDVEKKLDAIIRRLDVLATLLLLEKGLKQKEIGKILGISHDKIQDIFGKSYTKLNTKQSDKNE